MSYGPPPPPGGYGTGGYPSQQPYSGEPPKNYLVYNILGLFGCLSVLNIIGLIFALQVDSKWRMGDYIGAEEAAKTAKIMGIIGLVGFILLIAFLVVYFLVFVLVFGMAATSSATY
ncbi:CD225/dispanin family protein [Nocardiopsis sp. LOL_012]|uniref:CD225/dispanin family protein n=1 Tax=Nocardiopsis sp. LOL_012 TaxID=3345409 RepID=UPI003A882EBD